MGKKARTRRYLQKFGRKFASHPYARAQAKLKEVKEEAMADGVVTVEEKLKIDQLVGRINGRFSDDDWVPLRYLYRSFPLDELVAFYRQADVCLVTPLRDGMNLVVKEFVAAQGNDPGVAVLSRFCGAAETMSQAMIVNPYDVMGTVEAIYRALRMPQREKARRWNALMEDIKTTTAKAWSDSFLEDLARS